MFQLSMVYLEIFVGMFPGPITSRMARFLGMLTPENVR